MNSVEIEASTTSPIAAPVTTPATPSKPSTSTTPSRRSRRRNKASESLSKDFYEIYELDEPIGQGSCAVVRKAKHRRTGKSYAVKCVQTPSNAVEYRRVREKCLNEMMVLRACEDSDKIIKLQDFKEDQHHFFMVFELVEGGNLQEFIDLRDGGKLQLNEAACVVRDLAEGLKFLHAKGIVHRDMKPDNILCCDGKFASPCKIIDFDLAKAHEADNSGNHSNQTSPTSYSQKHSNMDSGIDHSSPDLGMSPVSGNWRDRSDSPHYGMYRENQRYLPMTSPVGSPEYMPPEIVEKCLDDYYNLDEYNQSCDIWSLGIIAYMTISGRAPFVAQTADCSFKDCEWNYGGQCPDCQESLWDQILNADLEFPDFEGWRHVPESAKDLIRCCLDRNIYGRISAAEILEHPFIENYALTNEEIAKNPSQFEKLNPKKNHHAKKDHHADKKLVEAKAVEELFEKMKLPTEILEGSDDTGYQPFEYYSESDMAYSPPRSQPIPIRPNQTINQAVIAQPRIQVSNNPIGYQLPAMLVPPQQLAFNHQIHNQPNGATLTTHQDMASGLNFPVPPINHAIHPRSGIPMPSQPVGESNNSGNVGNGNINHNPFYRSNSQFF